MEQIKQTIDNTIYGYDPKEFMPIRVDGQVANWDAFVLYKAQRVARRAGHAIAAVVETIYEATQPAAEAER